MSDFAKANVLTWDGTEWVETLPDAIPDSVVENFERDDPLDDYSGELGIFDIITSDTLEGDKSLEGDGSSGSDFIYYISPENAPVRGWRFSWLVEHRGSDSSENIYWAVSGDPEQQSYGAYTSTRDDEIRFYKDNSEISSESSGISFDTGETYQVVVDWADNGDIDITAYDFDLSASNPFDYDGVTPNGRGSEVGSLSVNDDDYESGGIGFRSFGSTGNPAVWDWWVNEFELD